MVLMVVLMVVLLPMLMTEVENMQGGLRSSLDDLPFLCLPIRATTMK